MGLNNPLLMKSFKYLYSLRKDKYKYYVFFLNILKINELDL